MRSAGAGASGDLGDEHPRRPVVEGRVDGDAHRDRPHPQALAHPRRRAPRRLEAEALDGRVVWNAAPLQHVLLRVGHRRGIGRPDVRRDLGGHDPEGAALLHGLLPQAPESGIAEDDRPADVLPGIVGLGRAGADVDEPGAHPSRGGGERVDGQRHAVALARQQHRVRPLREGERADAVVPAAPARRVLVHPKRGLRLPRTEAGRREPPAEILDGGVEPRVPGQAPGTWSMKDTTSNAARRSNRSATARYARSAPGGIDGAEAVPGGVRPAQAPDATTSATASRRFTRRPRPAAR